jgi:hypothetical protein
MAATGPDIHADVVEQDVGVKCPRVALYADLDESPARLLLVVVVVWLTVPRRAISGLPGFGVAMQVWLRAELHRLADCGVRAHRSY